MIDEQTNNAYGLIVFDGTRLNKKHVYLILKRAFDLSSSIILLIFLLPIFALIALAIKIDSKGKVIYKHKRIGKNGKPFYIYKFRTMYDDANEKLEELLKDKKLKEEWKKTYKLKNDPRITKVGKILRRTSLDELPQLINIIKGQMSFIGPRPIVDGEIEKYGYSKNKFLSVTPGLTGWWACNGRSNTTYEERVELELYYIDNMSVSMDIKCIIKTITCVIKKVGAM